MQQRETKWKENERLLIETLESKPAELDMDAIPDTFVWPIEAKLNQIDEISLAAAFLCYLLLGLSVYFGMTYKLVGAGCT